MKIQKLSGRIRLGIRGKVVQKSVQDANSATRKPAIIVSEWIIGSGLLSKQMTTSHLVRRFNLKRGRKSRPEPSLAKCQCGYSPVLASSFDVVFRRKLFWFECPNDECKSLSPLPLASCAEAAVAWNALKLCLSCGKPAVLSNEDGRFCKDCMQIHLLEKLFVQVAKIQGNAK